VASSNDRRLALHARLERGVFDAVIVGGGIYGALLALEGVARGQRVVLLERGDFGGGTSFNSLRTIHGGLRYLQFLDVPRALISNAQRRWWLRTFPDLVQPISCLMPLYGEGLRRPFAFRMAFLLARLLRLGRDAQGRPGTFRVLPGAATRGAVQMLRESGLQGGAVWQDAFMPHSERIIVESLRWAEASGALLADHAELVAAERRAGDDVWRLAVKDTLTGRDLAVQAGTLISAAGSSIDTVAARITGGRASPVLVPTLAWNLLLARPPVSEHSLALKPPGPGRRTYFVHPFHGRLLAGTGHIGLRVPAERVAGVSDEDVAAMLADLNESLPGFALTPADVKHVLWGILPGVQAGSDELLMRPTIIDHGAEHGCARAWSVLGVKFTEAPFVAQRVWNAVLGDRPRRLPSRPEPRLATNAAALGALSDTLLQRAAQELLEHEWCGDLDDLIWRRTDLWMHPALGERVRRVIGDGRSAGQVV
jgi:glycerol-3-phosphate dehydrogenase